MKRESHSAKETGKRPVFNEIVEELAVGKYNGILTWAPDRIEQLISLLDKIDLSETGVRVKFEDELKRHNKFHRAVLGMKGKADTHQEVDLKDYAKYVLRDGTNEEKRELMGCFKTRLIVSKRAVILAQDETSNLQ